MKKHKPHLVAPRREPQHVARLQAIWQAPAGGFDVLHLQELALPTSGPPGDLTTYDHVRVDDVPEEYRPELERQLRDLEAAGLLCGVLRKPDGCYVILIRSN